MQSSKFSDLDCRFIKGKTGFKVYVKIVLVGKFPIPASKVDKSDTTYLDLACIEKSWCERSAKKNAKIMKPCSMYGHEHDSYFSNWFPKRKNTLGKSVKNETES